MTNGQTQHKSLRYTFLGLIAWLSVCLLVVGLFPQEVVSFGKFWTVAGLFGLVSAVGLSESLKSELRAHTKLLSNYVNEARTDALTGLGNRRAFDAEMNEWESQWGNGQTFSLLLIDVDHFKRFNDTYGHQAGDEMLRSVAQVLNNKTEGIGRTTRYGGEEFAVMLPDIPLEEACTLGEALRDVIAGHETRFRAEDLRVTVSMGVAQASPKDTVAELVVQADEQLYIAKKAGRDCVRPEQPCPSATVTLQPPYSDASVSEHQSAHSTVAS